MDADDVTAAKRRAAESAVAAVEDGDVVGLGTGSTAAHAIDALGDAVDRGRDLRGVPTSFQSRERARAAGIPLVDLADVDAVDVAIDGADQVAGLDAIKGGGAAHAREKVVDVAADRLLLVVDERKEATALSAAVPVEVLPMARSTATAAMTALGGSPELRAAERKDGPVITDNGNLVVDCAFGEIADPGALAAEVAAIPGVVAHGLFVDMADEVHVGTADGVAVRR